MGLSAPSLKYILSISKKYNFRGPLLTYGNQDIYATLKNLNIWLKECKINPTLPLKPYQTTSQDLKNINKEANSFIHAKTFFSSLGIKDKDYYDVDKFSFDKPRIVHDLEKPFSQKFHNFFNLVIDSGTIEHIFDIRAVMANTIRITKIGAYVLHLTPTNNFLNHGFYQISPTFFYDFYTANGFKVVESYITESRATKIIYHRYFQKSFNYKFFVNPYSRLGSVFLLKKIKQVKKIVSPTQYYYANTVKHFDKTTNILRRLIPFKYQSLFYLPWVIVNQLFSKRNIIEFDFK